MRVSEFSDEQLMAYADGQLDENLAAEILMASQNDDKVLKRIHAFKRSRDAAKQSMDLQLLEPVPASLEAGVLAMLAASNKTVEPAAVKAAEIRVIAAKQASNDNKRTDWFQLAAAASIALVIGIFAGSRYTNTGTPTSSAQIAMGKLSDVELTELLMTASSGEERALKEGGRFKAIATFNDAQNAVCREFELDAKSGDTIVSVVCRNDAAWELRFAVAAGQTSEGFAPASSLELLDSYYANSGASAVLSADAEEAALEALRSAE